MPLGQIQQLLTLVVVVQKTWDGMSSSAASELSGIGCIIFFNLFFIFMCILLFHWGTRRILNTFLNIFYAFLKSPGCSSCGLCWMIVVFLILIMEAAEFHDNINLHWCSNSFLVPVHKDTYHPTDVLSVCAFLIVCFICQISYQSLCFMCRSLAVGSGSMMCRAGSVVAPFCVYLRSVWIFMPLVSIYFNGECFWFWKGICVTCFLRNQKLNLYFEKEIEWTILCINFTSQSNFILLKICS